MIRRVDDITKSTDFGSVSEVVRESVTEMMAQIDAIMALYQQEVELDGRFNGSLAGCLKKA